MTVVLGCIGQSNRFIHRYKISRLGHTVWMNFRPLTIQVTFIYLFAIPSITSNNNKDMLWTKWMPKNDTSEILLVDQPGNDKLCRLRRLLDAITKTCLYNFDPFEPHFYIEKLGFTRVYIIYLISAQNINCGYSLQPPHRGGSNEYNNLCFEQKIWKNIRFFLSKNFFVFGDENFNIFE